MWPLPKGAAPFAQGQLTFKHLVTQKALEPVPGRGGEAGGGGAEGAHFSL